MIGRIDINSERDISRNYCICDVHFHPLMIENGRLKKYALPIIDVSSDCLTSSEKFLMETQANASVSASYTETNNEQNTDNAETNYIESFEEENDSAHQEDVKYAIPIIDVSSDRLISPKKYSVETQTSVLVSSCFTQTDNIQITDVQTNYLQVI